MATPTGFWGEAIEDRCQAMHLDSQATAAARLIGQALDLQLVTLQDVKVIKQMSSGQQLDGWLCALAADVALASGELLAGGA